MGNTAKFPNWHVYTAADHNMPAADPIYTLEMCMTELNKKSALERNNMFILLFDIYMSLRIALVANNAKLVCRLKSRLYSKVNEASIIILNYQRD
jgi:hypothetical protein